MKIIIIVISLLAVGLFFLTKFLKNVQPTSSEVDDDLATLKNKISNFKGGFVEWTDNISTSKINQILTKNDTRTGDGVFLSDSGDPVFAYAFKKYIGPGRNEVIYILTNEHEYIFRITNKGTEITKDGKRAGMIKENGRYVNAKNQEVAELKKQSASGYDRIFIESKEVAKIALPDTISVSALNISDLHLEPTQKDTIKTIAIFNLVDNISEIKN